MCLYVSNKERKIANKDITCYKIMRRDMFDKWSTPYQHFDVDEIIISGKKPMIADGKEEIVDCNGGCRFSVNNGFLHTFVKKDDAKSMMPGLSSYLEPAFIFECIIPKGTEYYIGTCSTGQIGYASKSIRFSKEIDYCFRF